MTYKCEQCGSTNTRRMDHVIIFCHDCHEITNIFDLVGSPPADYVHPFPHSVVVSIKSPQPFDMVLDEAELVYLPDILSGDPLWQWMRERKHEFGPLLVNENLGYSDGFGMGFGALDITFWVNDIEAAVKVLFDYLTDVELIQFVTMTSQRKHTHWQPGDHALHPRREFWDKEQGA